MLRRVATALIVMLAVPLHADTLREGVKDAAVKTAEEKAESTAAVDRPRAGGVPPALEARGTARAAAAGGLKCRDIQVDWKIIWLPRFSQRAGRPAAGTMCGRPDRALIGGSLVERRQQNPALHASKTPYSRRLRNLRSAVAL